MALIEAEKLAAPTLAPATSRNLLLFNLKTDADDDILGFTTDWTNALAPYFQRIQVITMDMGRLAVADNVSVTSVGKERGWSEPRRAIEFYKLLNRVLSETRVDACFAHMMPLFVALGGPILRIKNIPVTLWYAHKSVTPTLRVATYYSDRVLTSTRAGFQLTTPKLRIIGQGIDTARFRPSLEPQPRSAFNIIHVGRISAVKRIEVLLQALALLRARQPERAVTITFVGRPMTDIDYSYVQDIKTLVASLDLAEEVRFAGHVSFRDVHTTYTAADCMVNPSEVGALDKTVLEAMSCGLPVITSNHSYQGVLGDELGEWVTASDPGAIADRVERLMRLSPNDRRALGLRFRAIVERDHSLPRLAARIASEINETIEYGVRANA